jgi:tRNA(Arg) A34 adenosine deaminase TadA
MKIQHMIDLLRVANQIAIRAMSNGHHPFGAILVADDGHTVLEEQGNIDTVNHAESTLARKAYAKYSPQVLWESTLVTTVEPCAMCAATQYWSHIGRLIYGVTEQDLLEITGNHAENPTLNLPCRDVFAAGQKEMVVWGPVVEMRQEILQVHQNFWHQNQPH